MKKSLIIGAAFSGLVILSSAAEAKPAKCDITSDGVGRYVGECDFVAKKGGSFSISLPPEADQEVYTKFIYINIVAPGRGRIGGAGGMGRESDWGTVQRDAKKPACWFGEWGRVCVY
jgi:hypothetical protein